MFIYNLLLICTGVLPKGAWCTCSKIQIYKFTHWSHAQHTQVQLPPGCFNNWQDGISFWDFWNWWDGIWWRWQGWIWQRDISSPEENCQMPKGSWREKSEYILLGLIHHKLKLTLPLIHTKYLYLDGDQLIIQGINLYCWENILGHIQRLLNKIDFQAWKKSKKAIEQFGATLYHDKEFSDPPYDLEAPHMREYPLKKFMRCCLVTISYHLTQAFTTYISLIP